MKTFRIMKCEEFPCSVDKVPFDDVEKHDQQARFNHSQTVERLNERGGLDPVEFYAVMNDLSLRKAYDKLAREAAAKWIEDVYLNKKAQG